MNLEEIEKGVRQEVQKWSELSEYRREPRVLTEGAVRLLIQLVENIERDRSPHWRDFQYDDIQRYVVSIVPNMLVDIDNHLSRGWKSREISSWEILHGISFALTRWCPVPKDI
ncbi:hypothetical protein ACFFJT_08825 [Dyella flava]|uniref:Uncharacterized protein n=1 Tax=Dyella flava TaxID=1920170 RepID=A0ABS2K976_9GAMM|nr:hypothetical protein [Dyella flava]MBM7127694.1 hypothetical protein [Dyella flava]GLQ51293.1 hypothetical protein GCM10010872_27420 [Dyella flava]